MNELLKSILSDVDSMSSSKRIVLLWIAIFVWSFVHVVVFLSPKDRFPTELPSTLIMYDAILIGACLGFVLGEKIWGRDKPDNTTKP
jgi:hypothetical protein